MAGNWGNIASAALNGYLQGRRIVRDDEEYESDKKYKTRVRAAQMRKLDREEAVDRDLASASQRQAVTERVVKPDTMDNRDVGQVGEPPMVAGADTAAAGQAGAAIANGAADAQRSIAATSMASADAANADIANRAALSSQQAGVVNQDVAAEGAAPMQAAVAAPPAAPMAPVGVQSYEVGGKTFANRAAAQAAADAANSPEATVGRMSEAYMRNGMPTEALTLQQKQSQMLKAAEEMKEKGVFEGMRQFRLGDKTAALATLKKSGLFKVGDGPVTMTPVETEVPGAGKIKTFDLTFPMVGDDGKTTPFTLNSHQASLALMPYDKALDLSRKGVATEASIEAKKDSLDIARQRLELTGAMNEARIAKMQAGGGGRGGASSDRETRIAVQATATAINREISETNKAIKDRLADLPRASQASDPLLNSLYKQQAALGGQRDAVQEQLVNIVEKKVGAEGAAGIRKSKGDASPPKDKSGAVKVTTRGDYEALPSGAVYIHPKTGEKLVKK